MMKKHLLLLCVITMVALGTVCAAQNLPKEGEPEYYELYRERALQLVDAVTSSVDDIKMFRESPRFKDIATSVGVQDEYTSRINTLNFYYRTVHTNLLSTPAIVLRTSEAELKSIKAMNTFRD